MSVGIKNWFKFVLGFFALVALAIALIWAIFYFKEWQERKKIDRLAENIKKYEQAEYTRMMADTYGGKTPQETLQMYIAAVEESDFDLASKYFIEDAREKELRSFQDTTVQNLKNYIVLLKEVSIRKGNYFSEDKRFSVDEPIHISFRLYPNRIWKIVEI